MSNSVSVRADSGFLFLDLRTTEGKSELRRQIACQVGTRFRGSQLTAPAERLVGLIEARRYATAILERAYIDIDHRAALARFYRLRHRDTGGRCVRVHLFECWIDESKLECLTDDEIRSYRGFLVLRPFSHDTLGRCILTGDLLRAEPRTYVTCKAPYTVHLAGHEIKFEGTPWMQQDGMVSACASAAMWVSGWHLGHSLSGEHRLYTTPEITELCTRYSLATGRAMPSGGLTTDQMANGFQAMGHPPLLIGETETPTAALARRFVYAYIESAIPGLLSLNFPLGGGHAVTVVGHKLEVKPLDSDRFTSDGRPPLRYFDASQFARTFIVQDDAGGPFRSAEFLDSEEWKSSRDPDIQILCKNPKFLTPFRRLKNDFSCGVLLDRGTLKREFGFLQSILIPSPARVTLGFDEAKQKAYALLVKFERAFREVPRAAGTQPGHLRGRLVLRSYLRGSNAFKAYCRKAKGLDPENVRRICWHPMPKWIWVTEITDLHQHRLEKASIGGFILLDAAGQLDAEPEEDLILMLTPQSLTLYYPDMKADSEPENILMPQPLFSRFERASESSAAPTAS